MTGLSTLVNSSVRIRIVPFVNSKQKAMFLLLYNKLSNKLLWSLKLISFSLHATQRHYQTTNHDVAGTTG